MNAVPELSTAIAHPPTGTVGTGAWLRPLHDWPRAAAQALGTASAIARVLVVSVHGSAPRAAGACMLVSRDGIQGSIGGGRLEWQGIAAARALLADAAEPAARLLRFVLGTELGQCCGGAVELWIERYVAADQPLLRAMASASNRWPRGWLRVTIAQTHIAQTHITCGSVMREMTFAPSTTPKSDGRSEGSTRRRSNPPMAATTPELRRDANGITLLEPLPAPLPPVWLYGAGHVGQALARALAELPFALTWIDTRAELLPATIPANVDLRVEADPVAGVPAAPPGSRFVVMTHDHGLDYRLCRAILARGDFGFAGLIGSASKAARFRSRLARDDGFDAATIARLQCPIGVAGITSKWPAAIAVAVAAQLLRTLPAGESSRRGDQAISHAAVTAAAPMPSLDSCPSQGCATCTHPR